ncbi:hypothetical protein V6N11_057221 [Hibiscus sabdariffa]|uniref:Uncharacterized protein n=1 Tax=Hibiscus sabdariffa TaxID=183260 RepID=A0ABR2NKN7_9ROSI
MDASIEDRYGARCSVRSWLMPECRTNMPAVAKAQEQLRDSGDDKEGPLPLHMPKPRSVKRGCPCRSQVSILGPVGYGPTTLPLRHSDRLELYNHLKEKWNYNCLQHRDRSCYDHNYHHTDEFRWILTIQLLAAGKTSKGCLLF